MSPLEQSRCRFSVSQSDALVLKLRCSRLPWINRPKTQGSIITRRVSEGFPETLRKTQKHNPSLTQRVGMVIKRATSKRVSEVSVSREENASLTFRVEISRRNQNRRLFWLKPSGDRRLKGCACVRRGSLVTPYRKASYFQSVNSECSGKHLFPIMLSFEIRPKPAGGAWQRERARSTVSSRPVPSLKRLPQTDLFTSRQARPDSELPGIPAGQ
jgi:hypothetical protein